MIALALGEGGIGLGQLVAQAITDLMPWVYWGADMGGDARL